MFKVLLIEDETLMRRVYRRIIPPDTFELSCVVSVDEAIEYLRLGMTPDVILSDFNLGLNTGDEVLRWIDTHRPELRDRFMFCTGRPNLASPHGVPVLSKPFRYEELVEMLHALASKPVVEREAVAAVQ